jgi:TetR/AcrR family transcriptional regulator, cholesterol catabolism regulator
MQLETRERIIEAARSMFFEFGIRKVKIDEIAAELGIGKATIYECFPSKQILVQSVLEEKRVEMEEYLTGLLQRISGGHEADMIDLMKELIHFGIRSLAEIKEPFLRDLKQTDAASFLDIVYYDMIDAIIDKILTRGMQEGIIRTDINIRILSEMILSFVNKVIRDQDFSAKVELSRAEILDNVVKIIMGGLLTSEGRSRGAGRVIDQ